MCELLNAKFWQFVFTFLILQRAHTNIIIDDEIFYVNAQNIFFQEIAFDVRHTIDHETHVWELTFILFDERRCIKLMKYKRCYSILCCKWETKFSMKSAFSKLHIQIKAFESLRNFSNVIYACRIYKRSKF